MLTLSRTTPARPGPPRRVGQPLDERVGQPRPDVRLAADPGGAQVVEAEPPGDGGQPAPQVGEPLLGVRPGVAQPRVLHDVLVVGAAAEHPVRHAEQMLTVRAEPVVGSHDPFKPIGRAFPTRAICTLHTIW